MKIGAWIHSHNDIPLEHQIELAATQGLQTIRSYHFDYARAVAPTVKRLGMSLLGGMHVDSQALVSDWRSQVHLDELARYHQLGVTLEGICVGNELREGGDEPHKKRFTARLSYGLTRVLETYRAWLDEQGHTTRLTYAMEGIVFDGNGGFYEWVWPLIEACDVVSINHYPMGNRAWFTFDAFEESRRFLYDGRTRNLRLSRFNLQLRRTLEALTRIDKPLILTETGFPSAIGYQMEDERLVIPESDNVRYGQLMIQFVDLIREANDDYDNQILAIYFYEWRDNLYHSKIWNVEQSPIHVAFGLCDRFGKPKFDIRVLTKHSHLKR
jgi:hypothetical protein